MTNRKLFFKAVFVGPELPEQYVDRIQIDPLYRIKKEVAEGGVRLEILGPLKENVVGNYEEVRATCESRAMNLGVTETDAVASTASKIVYADIAERHVLAALLVINLKEQEGKTQADLILSVIDEGPKDARLCIPDIARWRISCIAQVLRMQIEGTIKLTD